MSIAATQHLLASSEAEAEARFFIAADRLTQSLANRMTQYEQGLVAGAALVATVDKIDRAAWGRFVAGQNIRKRFPGIQAMGLAVWVTQAEREAHVAWVRSEDLPTYSLRPPGEREGYLPILFNEPYEGRNRAVVGFDMLSEQVRRAAILRATGLHEPTISGMVVLAGESAEERPPGFVYYVPAKDASGMTKGVVFAPFRAQDLIAAVREETGGSGLNLILSDGEDTLYADRPLANMSYRQIKELAIGGRNWRIEITSDVRFRLADDQLRAWMIGVAGLSVTLILIIALSALAYNRITTTRFRIFATLGSDWVWEQDARQRFSYFNDPQGHYRGGGSVIGMTRASLFEEVGDPAEQDRHRDVLARMERRQPIRDFEYRSRSIDGTMTVIRLSAEPIYGFRNSFLGYAGIAKDVTIETLREAALVEAKRTAEIASKTKSNFLATMSHELRTPLNAIIGFAELIERQHFGPVANPRYVEYATDIRQSGDQLLALVNDILDIAKIESGKLSLSLSPIQIRATLEQCGVTVGDQAARKNLVISAEIQPDMVVLADQRALRQILLNLMSNAVKFTSEGGRISISAERQDSWIVIAVRDSGVGIAPEALSRIFTPFYQADSAVTIRHGGTGLGLSISKMLTEAMGGQISIASEPGVGTTVVLRLAATTE